MKIVILPLGSIEQHGNLLGNDVDHVLANFFSSKIKEELSNVFEIEVLPSLPFGIATEHIGFPNTISISIQAYINVVTDIITSIKRSFSPNLIVLYNSHGGNSNILNAVSCENNYTSKIKCMYYSHFNTVIESKIEKYWGVGETHAGSFESSCYYYAKNLRKYEGKLLVNKDYKKKINSGLKYFRSIELTELGVITDSDSILLSEEKAIMITKDIIENFKLELDKIITNINLING